MSAPTHLRLAWGPGRAPPKVVVIGAGLGGLAVALRLQGAGFEVTVLEQRPTPAAAPRGCARTASPGTPGPSLITMPWVLEEAFAAGGLDLHSEVACAGWTRCTGSAGRARSERSTSSPTSNACASRSPASTSATRARWTASWPR